MLLALIKAPSELGTARGKLFPHPDTSDTVADYTDPQQNRQASLSFRVSGSIFS